MLGSLILALALAQTPSSTPSAASDPPKDSAARKEVTVALGVGIQMVFNATAPIKAVAVVAPEIAEVTPLGRNQFLVVGLAVGDSSLFVFDERGGRTEYRIEVRSKDPINVIDLPGDFLGDLSKTSPRFTHSVVGNRYVFDGLIGTLEDYQRIQHALQLWPQIKMLARLDPQAIRQSVDTLNDRLLRAGLRDVRAVAVGNTVMLEGSVADESQSVKAVAIAQDLLGPFFAAASGKPAIKP